MVCPLGRTKMNVQKWPLAHSLENLSIFVFYQIGVQVEQRP